MDKVRVIEIKKSVLENNERAADLLRERLKARKICLLNLMSSPGSGKTITVIRTIENLKNEMRIGVMEADIDSDIDAVKVAETGVRAVQLHTGGMCHLDAGMTQQGLNEIGIEDLDLVILENVGNLVCPAEFDTGATLNVMILSICEGHDKPLKYPLMFSKVDVMLINKIDCAALFDFDLDKVQAYARKLNPDLEIFPMSAKTGEGFDAWVDWLRRHVTDVMI